MNGVTDGTLASTAPADDDWKADLRSLEGTAIVDDAAASGDVSGTSEDVERVARPADAAPSGVSRDDGSTQDQYDPNTTTNGAPDATGDSTTADPLQGAEPLAYEVNGQSVTFDGAHVIPGEGAIITADALPKLQERLSRADYLEGANRELYQTAQRYERLTEYTPIGAAEPLTGQQALEALRVDQARTYAVANVLAGLMADPGKLADLLNVQPMQDGSSQIVFNPQAHKALALEIENARIRAEQQTRTQFAQHLQRASADPSAPSPGDAQTQATFERALSGFQQAFPQLTAEDVQAARQQFGPFLSALTRPATPDEARQLGIRPGAMVLDPSKMEPWVRERVQLRQRLTQTMGTVTAAARTNAPPQTTQKRQAGGTPPNRPAASDRPKEPETWSDARRDLRRAFRDAFTANG